MSIFSSIMNKIFHHEAQAAPAPQASSTSPQAAPPSSAPAPTATTTSAAANSSTGANAPVDVEAVLTGMASKSSQKLDWQKSIVDLMKLLNLDSSLPARKELAKELNYTGDTNDSATMNIWLHKQVMTKLAENGGKVPDSLKA